MAEMISVEVVYATPERQELIRFQIPQGTSALDAIERSGIRKLFPEIVVDESRLGIFSNKISGDYLMREGDRLEIYRPLIADPKESRRQRAKKQG